MVWLWSRSFREWTWSEHNKLVFLLKNRTLNYCLGEQLISTKIVFSDLGHHGFCFLFFWNILNQPPYYQTRFGAGIINGQMSIWECWEDQKNAWGEGKYLSWPLCTSVSTTFIWKKAVELLLAATYFLVLESFVLPWLQSDYGYFIWQNKVIRLFTVTNIALFNNPSPSKNTYI